MAKPKEQFQNILHTIFDLIEDEVKEGVYLQVADQMKQANNLISAMTEEKQVRIITLIREARHNTYYRHYYRNSRYHTGNSKLNEAEKAKSSDYYLCECGRYCHKKAEYIKEHLETEVHRQGLRNKKHSALKSRKINDDIKDGINITDEINREVVVEGFCIKHLIKIKQQQEQV
jgi:hypothetical protein